MSTITIVGNKFKYMDLVMVWDFFSIQSFFVDMGMSITDDLV